MLALLNADLTILYKLRDTGGAQRITACQADKESRHTGSGDTEQTGGERGQMPAKPGRKAEPVHQDGNKEEGKERRQDQLDTETQPVPAAFDHLAGCSDQNEQRT